jgi:hypothetical protein
MLILIASKYIYIITTITNSLKDYFIDLLVKELYSAKQLCNRIALIAIYIPII